MKFGIWLFAAVLSMAGISCNETAPPPERVVAGDVIPEAPRPALPAPPTGGSPSRIASPLPGPAVEATAAIHPSPSAVPALSSALPVNSAPLPPKDAQWTIFCFSITGPNHVEESRRFKEDLVRQTKRSDWYVIHGRDETNLYFGYYRAINGTDDAKEVSRAKSDRQSVAGIADRNQDKPFRNCMFVALGAPDPASRPEWSLANVDRDLDPRDPKRRFWSLQVMAFKDNPRRKEAAVQAVEALRNRGIEAYYHHGEVVSSVCVGAWAMDAVKRQADDGTHTFASSGTVPFYYSEQLPDGLMPPGKTADGKRIVRVAPKLEIIDKSLWVMSQKFPEHSINYEVHGKKTRSGTDVPDPSFVVEIPRPRGNSYFDYDDTLATVPPPQPTQNPAASVTPTDVRSRSAAMHLPSDGPSRTVAPAGAAPLAPDALATPQPTALRPAPAPSDPPPTNTGRLRRVTDR